MKKFIRFKIDRNEVASRAQAAAAAPPPPPPPEVTKQTESVTNVHTMSVPNVHTMPVPNVQTMSVPNVYTASVPNVYQESVPNVYQASASNVYQGSVPNVYTASAQNVYQASVPNIYNASAPNVYTASAPNAHTVPVSNVYTASIQNVHTMPVQNVHTMPVQNVHAMSVPNVHAVTVPNVYTASAQNVHAESVPNVYTGSAQNVHAESVPNVYATSVPASVPNVYYSQYMTTDIHPPLPLDPPPPDDFYDIQIKEEVVDPEYQTYEETDAKAQEAQEACETEDKVDKPKTPICRDFIRGTCKRMGTCRFAHKYDVSQLAGVYTFCHKYQNSVCTYANCKYVHASVFEERHFYRTGILPPHALAHHKKVMPPPPPPPPIIEEPAKDHIVPTISFSQPPPPIPPEFTKPPPVAEPQKTYTCPHHHPMINIERRTLADILSGRDAASLKRQWEALEGLGALEMGFSQSYPMVKKCKNCDIMEFRVQYNRDKVQKMIQSRIELEQKKALLDKKNDKLCAILMALLKPHVDGDRGI